MNILENNKDINPEDFYKSLKQKLEDNHSFPENYIFKFILPANEAKLVEIYQIFDEMKYTSSNRESKNAKYTSLTVEAFVLDANQVTDIYKKVGEIEGVIML